MSHETKSILESAAFEIRDLRRRCELLQAKVDGFELAGRLLSATQPGSNMGYTEDIAWKCDKEAERLGKFASPLGAPTPNSSRRKPLVSSIRFAGAAARCESVNNGEVNER